MRYAPNPSGSLCLIARVVYFAFLTTAERQELPLIPSRPARRNDWASVIDPVGTTLRPLEYERSTA